MEIVSISLATQLLALSSEYIYYKIGEPEMGMVGVVKCAWVVVVRSHAKIVIFAQPARHTTEEKEEKIEKIALLKEKNHFKSQQAYSL